MTDDEIVRAIEALSASSKLALASALAQEDDPALRALGFMVSIKAALETKADLLAVLDTCPCDFVGAQTPGEAP